MKLEKLLNKPLKPVELLDHLEYSCDFSTFKVYRNIETGERYFFNEVEIHGSTWLEYYPLAGQMEATDK